jgi:phage shock protein A
VDRFQTGLDAQTKFDRMENKVTDMEARAAAIAELEDNASSLEKEFLQMAVDQEVEVELAMLKVKVQKK